MLSYCSEGLLLPTSLCPCDSFQCEVGIFPFESVQVCDRKLCQRYQIPWDCSPVSINGLGQALGLYFKINLAYLKSFVWVNESCSLCFQIADTVLGVRRVASGVHIPSGSFLMSPNKGICL